MDERIIFLQELCQRIGIVRNCAFDLVSRDADWDLRVGPFQYFRIIHSEELAEGPVLWSSVVLTAPKTLLKERCRHIPVTLLHFFENGESIGGATIDWNSANTIYAIDEIAYQRRFDPDDRSVKKAMMKMKLANE